MSYQYINRSHELDTCIQQLTSSSEIAIDLEFDKNYHRYGFNLCLIQIYNGENCYLIDPLSDQLNIEPIFPVLENPQIQKVCFSFDEDLRLLHSIGCFPKNLYDLGIASRLINYPQMSLTNLVDDLLDVETGKSSQTSNWFKRPLTDRQMRYAAEDVLFLLDLKQIISEKAEEIGVESWIEEENGSLNELDYSEINHNNNIKEKDKGDLTEFEWHIFKALMKFRKEVAIEVNRPGFQIIKKDYLTDIAKDSRNLMHWTSKRGLYRSIKNEETKNRVLSIVKNASDEAEKLGLSKTKPAHKSLSDVEYAELRKEKSRVGQIKSQVFDPIKDRIEEDYGKETVTFLFSNRIVADIITGKNDELAEYKKNLIMKYAEDLSIDVEVVLSEASV